MDIGSAQSKINELIREITNVHSDLCDEWIRYAKDNRLELFNQKAKKVVDIEKDRLMPVITRYTQFLRERSEITQFDYSDRGFIVNSRIKNINCIEEKYDEYLNARKEKGEVSINKCFNDLFGIRAIIDCDSLTHDYLKSNMARDDLLLEEKDTINRKTKITYKATHIYFKRDNISFRWELQIWKQCDERSNQKSHERHRYKYTEWESQTKKRDITQGGTK